MKRLFPLIFFSYFLLADEPLSLFPGDPLILSEENRVLLYGSDHAGEVQILLNQHQFPWLEVISTLLVIGTFPYLLKAIKDQPFFNQPSSIKKPIPLHELKLIDLDEFATQLERTLRENDEIRIKNHDSLLSFQQQLTFLRYRQKPISNNEKILLQKQWEKVIEHLV